MDQTTVKIQLNNNIINTNNEKRENTTQTNQKCSELTKILIAFFNFNSSYCFYINIIICYYKSSR